MMYKSINIVWILWVCSFSAGADEWMPFSLAWDQSPIDLRYMLDAPAGKHGYLGYKNNQFRFEDNTIFRPWGISLSGEACFPPHDQIPHLAERIVRMGCNLVRFNNIDSPAMEPPLIQSYFPVHLNAEWMDRLDYFIFQLESRGVYVCFGGLHSLELNENSGIELWDRIQPKLKNYIHFIPELQEIYADFLHAFWTHRNPYNHGNQYRDCSSIVFTQLFHDNTIEPSHLTIPQYNRQLFALWTDWLQQYGHPLQEEFNFDEPTKRNHQFLSELTAASYTHWHTYLRSLNVKSLITAEDHSRHLRDLPPLWGLDFIAAAGTWNEALGKNHIVPVDPMLSVDLQEQSSLFSELSFSRLKDKPFLVSGWSERFPNPYRAELPLWVAAMSGYQNWQGAVMDFAQSGQDYQTANLTPSNHWIDPSVMGLLPTASILFHQNKISPAKTNVTMKLDHNMLFDEDQTSLYDARSMRLVEKAMIQVDISGNDISGKASGANVYSPTMPESIDELETKPSPHFFRDQKRGLLVIDTPEVKAFVGNISSAQNEDNTGFRIRSQEHFAVISAAGLDQKPLDSSEDILITVVSRSQNTGMLTLEQGFGISLLRPGTLPILIKNTPCRISVQTQAASAELTTLHPGGAPGTHLPFQIQDGWLSFNGGVHQTIYYRLSCRYPK